MNKIIITVLAIVVLGGGAIAINIGSNQSATNTDDANIAMNIGSSTQTQQPTLTVYKSPDCGCCSNWTNYVKRRGYEIKIIDTDNMAEIKDQYGIPDDLTSCHTTIIGDYFVEGHIPTEAIDKLLAERPDITGIALAGMPTGSPGMPGNRSASLEIYTVTHDAHAGEIFMKI